MHLKFYRSPSHRPFDAPKNKGIEEAEELLRLLQQRGVPVEVVDTATMPEHERDAAYYAVSAAVAVRKHRRVRRIFGSNGQRGTAFFGREVPALLVYNGDSAYPTDVYPQERDGAIITIRDYLAGL